MAVMVYFQSVQPTVAGSSKHPHILVRLPERDSGLISISSGTLVDVFRCNTIREDTSVLRTLKVTRPHESKKRHITVTTKCINSIPYIIIINWIWNRPGLLCHSLRNSFPGCYQFIWLCSFRDGSPRKEKATITGGLSSLAMLTTPLMAVMQLTRLLWVRARGDSRSVQQPQGKNKILPLWWQLLWRQTLNRHIL